MEVGPRKKSDSSILFFFKKPKKKAEKRRDWRKMEVRKRKEIVLWSEFSNRGALSGGYIYFDVLS